ncbi:hypothetical protein H8S90_24470 [Olivibacter sp. SDN3]|uniref:putative nucleotide-diphospho-sugar transferase n=1 Tax=Olivibacter sp. SDN3 TaxID=2764720 RepID=UPI001651311D|nr:putative nucleotide-diphospho-sugar transferase [Olivibacter sp. SDN3]QNL49819.1 hypothetical protein H8S90_24470 [Olivibacter sp. SDN3]
MKKSHFKDDQKIPILTYYSQSHEILFKRYFQTSFNAHLTNDFRLVVKKASQKCNAVFRQDSWNEQVKEKIIYVNNFIQKSACKYFLFSDVDIVFFKNFKTEILQELGSCDAIFQSDTGEKTTYHNLCSGFYFCKINPRTKFFFNQLVINYKDYLSDQQNLNYLLPNSGLRYTRLSKKFFNFSYKGERVWKSGDEIAFPSYSISMYHANYTIGTENKEYLLKNFIKWNQGRMFR